MPGSDKASTSTSCTSSADALGTAPGQQVSSEQGGIVAALLPDACDQGMGGRVGQLIEPALERGGAGFGIEPGGGDAFVAEEALQVGDVHPQCEQESIRKCGVARSKNRQ